MSQYYYQNKLNNKYIFIKFIFLIDAYNIIIQYDKLYYINIIYNLKMYISTSYINF